jgi:lysophospholipase L1-like esterase/SAM-dependent methyltransferase
VAIAGDLWGEICLDHWRTGSADFDTRRDDGHVSTRSAEGYFAEELTDDEADALSHAQGRVLDVGCGPGRHLLWLQERGFEVTGIDISAGVVQVARERGGRDVRLCSLFELTTLREKFDTVLLMGNNMGLAGTMKKTHALLDELHQVTGMDAVLIGSSFNPRDTEDPAHLGYHRANEAAGRYCGEMRERFEYKGRVSPWIGVVLFEPALLSSWLSMAGGRRFSSNTAGGTSSSRTKCKPGSAKGMGVFRSRRRCGRGQAVLSGWNTYSSPQGAGGVRRVVTFLCIMVLSAVCAAQEARVVDSFGDLSAWKTTAGEDKVTTSPGPATPTGAPSLTVTVKEGVIFALAYRQFTPDADWNRFDGLAFRVKGDGSENWGSIRLQLGNYNRGYLGSLPLRDTEWHEVKLAWGDFVPASYDLPDLGSADEPAPAEDSPAASGEAAPAAEPARLAGGAKPGNIDLIGFGNSWNFTTAHKTPGVTFSVADLRLMTGVKAARPRVAIEALPPLDEARRKLQAGEPVVILALGDSITWGTNVGGNANAYPARLARMLTEHYKNEHVTVVSRAIGGSTTAKGRQWLKRDVAGVQADLVTVMFGYNEMPPAENPEGSAKRWVRNLLTYVEEVAGGMKEPPACILLASIPGRDKAWDRLDAYAEAVREAGRQYPNLAVADVNRHFKEMGKEAYASLMTDEAHPNQAGQEEMAKVLFQTITGGGERP